MIFKYLFRWVNSLCFQLCTIPPVPCSGMEVPKATSPLTCALCSPSKSTGVKRGRWSTLAFLLTQQKAQGWGVLCQLCRTVWPWARHPAHVKLQGCLPGAWGKVGKRWSNYRIKSITILQHYRVAEAGRDCRRSRSRNLSKQDWDF